jgi:hypothetical protein
VLEDEVLPLVYNVNDDIYNRQEIHFNSLSHLESLGFIQFNNAIQFRRMRLPKKVTISYYGRPVELTFPRDAENQLVVGVVMLTRTGEELAPVCKTKSVDGFFDFVYKQWEKESLVPKKENEQGTPADD